MEPSKTSALDCSARALDCKARALDCKARACQCWDMLTTWRDPTTLGAFVGGICIDRAIAKDCETVAITSLEELSRYRLEGSLGDFPKFATENELFEKARSFGHRVYIGRERSDGIPSLKNTIYVQVRGRSTPWEDLNARIARIGDSARQPNPFKSYQTILVTQSAYRLVNAGYTEGGICEDSGGFVEKVPTVLVRMHHLGHRIHLKLTVREVVAELQSDAADIPRLTLDAAACRPETKLELQTKLLGLSQRQEDLEDYLAQNCVCLHTGDKRANAKWYLEVVISRNHPKGPSEEHTFFRLVSPGGRVLSFGRWRWDDRRSKKNQRGITCSPDKSEWKIGHLLPEDHLHRELYVVYGGPIETALACDLLSTALTDFRHRTGLHYSLFQEGGGNCANFVFDALVKCRLQPPTHYAHIATDPREYALDMIDQTVLRWTKCRWLRWLRNHWLTELFVNCIKNLCPHFDYFYNRLFAQEMKVDLLSKTFEKEGGRRIFRNSREMGENFQIASPAKCDRYLQKVFAERNYAEHSSLWQLEYRHHYAKLGRVGA